MSTHHTDPSQPPSPSPAAVELLRSLSVLPDSQLALSILQRQPLCAFVTSTLHQSALYTLAQPLAAAPTNDAVTSIVHILSRLIERGDPSLARKLLPTPGSIVDFAIASSAHAPSTARDVAERLLDAYITTELLTGLDSELGALVSAQTVGIDRDTATARCAAIRSAARILAAVLFVCPPQTLKGSQPSVASLATLLRRAYQDALPAIARALGDIEPDELQSTRLDPTSWQLHWLTAKVDLIQAAYRLVRVCLDRSSPLAQPDSLGAMVLVTLASSSSPSRSGPATPLLNADLLEDVAGCFRLGSIVSGAKFHDAKAIAAVRRIKAVESGRGALATSKFVGPGWAVLQATERQRLAGNGGTDQDMGKGKGRDLGADDDEDNFSPDDTLLVTVNSVLPHLEIDRLRVVLARPSFQGQSAEEVIQRLLEGDEGDQGQEVPTIEAAAAAEPIVMRPESPDYVPPEPTASSNSTRKLVKSRANVFDDVPLDLSKSSWNQAKGKEAEVGALSLELKAAILARAEAESDDEEEEWNPFAETRPQRTVGVEDELDLDYDGREILRTAHAGADGDGDDGDEDEEPEGVQRRMGTVNLSSDRSSALEYSRYDATNAAAASSSSSRAAAANPAKGGADPERAAERILIQQYARYGPAAFGKDAATRKSAGRRELRTQLDALEAGTRWDDALIESWATMFERNPKRDRLLAAANEAVLGGPVNRELGHGGEGDAGGEGEDGPSRRFGPDRGRGGRILRGGRGGGGRSGGGGAARGGGGGGGGGGARGGSNSTRGGGGGLAGTSRGGGATRGRGTGNSHNDRSAKQKEKRGNQARKQGFDKKVAKGAAGASM
ncbi:hypothetical protein ACQY0O_001385 [Thecaphora frezii]